MTFLDAAIDRGTWNGIVQGLHSSLGRLPPGAYEVLRDPNCVRSAKEKGIRDGLQAIGYVRRRWYGPYWITAEGISALGAMTSPISRDNRHGEDG